MNIFFYFKDKNMIVSFAGTHSVGKTSLLEFVSDKFVLNSYTGITRIINKYIPINENGNDITQAVVITDHIRRSQIKNSIHDRSIIDGYAYTKYLYDCGKVSEDIFNYAKDSLYNYINNYDIILYIPIEFNIVEDGVRTMDEKFREDIDVIINNTITELMFNSEIKTKFYSITGSIQERCEELIKILKANE